MDLKFYRHLLFHEIEWWIFFHVEIEIWLSSDLCQDGNTITGVKQRILKKLQICERVGRVGFGFQPARSPSYLGWNEDEGDEEVGDCEVEDDDADPGLPAPRGHQGQEDGHVSQGREDEENPHGHDGGENPGDVGGGHGGHEVGLDGGRVFGGRIGLQDVHGGEGGTAEAEGSWYRVWGKKKEKERKIN